MFIVIQSLSLIALFTILQPKLNSHEKKIRFLTLFYSNFLKITKLMHNNGICVLVSYAILAYD